MIREVLKMGDERLLRRAAPVERFGTPELAALLADMHDTMAHLNGAGLAPLSDGIEESWEGCLSVPGMRGWVPRWVRLQYSGFDDHGRRFERSVDGFHARVVQHECDHLDCILYPMRIRDLSKFGFNEALFPGQDLPDEE